MHPYAHREPIRSLASVLEPREVDPFAVASSRLAVLPPDPEAFAVANAAHPRARSSPNDAARWLLRIALVAVVLVEELLLAAPGGALRPPHSLSDATTMIVAALRASAEGALER